MKRLQRVVALFLAAALTIGALAGCSAPKLTGKELSAKTIATYGDTAIAASEANFYLRSLQYTYEIYYGMLYGEDMWDMEVTTKKTMGDSVREVILSEVFQIYVLNEKAAELGISLSEADLEKVEKAVDEYLEETPETILEAVDLERAELVEIYKRNALANRVWEYAVKDTDTEVSDEEAMQRQVTVITLSDGASAYDSEEMKDDVLAALKEGKTMSDIAEEKSLTATPYHLGEGDYESSFGPKAMELEKDAYDAVYVESSANWYVMYCDETFDEEATETEKETIIEERKAAEFESVYAEWKTAAKAFEVDEDVADLLTFDQAMYVQSSQSSTQEGHEGHDHE